MQLLINTRLSRQLILNFRLTVIKVVTQDECLVSYYTRLSNSAIYYDQTHIVVFFLSYAMVIEWNL